MSAPSEPVTWKRIGVLRRECAVCGKPMKLDDVAHFGTRRGARFVECKDCFDGRPKAT